MSRRWPTVLLGLLLVSALVAAPGAASPTKKFEAKIKAPASDAGPEVISCPQGNQFDGMTYKIFDLKGDFTHFKSYGPKHLFNEPAPVHNVNDYDIDMYAFDAKCKEITPAGANGPAGTEAFSTKRPARYIVVAYWSGIHPDLPVTLEVANSKIP